MANNGRMLMHSAVSGGAGGTGGSGSYGGAGGNPFEGFDFSQFGGGGGFSSFFENLFGGRGRSQQSAEGFGWLRQFWRF